MGIVCFFRSMSLGEVTFRKERNSELLVCCVQVMILSQDKERGRISLSTKKLEPTPGDMLRNPALVYEKVISLLSSTVK